MMISIMELTIVLESCTMLYVLYFMIVFPFIISIIYYIVTLI